MKQRTRFIASVVKAAKTETPAVPFQRGLRRAAYIAKRDNVVELRKSA